MDNQHRKIDGYRELSADEIALINAIKSHGEELGELCNELATNDDIDKRWLAIATTDLQKGIMSLVRSIAQPTTF